MQRTGNKLYEMIEAPDENAIVGVTFVPGAGFRVGMVKDGAFEHMSAQAAWKMAQTHDAEIEDLTEPTGFARALGMTAGRVRAMGLAGEDAKGTA